MSLSALPRSVPPPLCQRGSATALLQPDPTGPTNTDRFPVIIPTAVPARGREGVYKRCSPEAACSSQMPAARLALGNVHF